MGTGFLLGLSFFLERIFRHQLVHLGIQRAFALMASDHALHQRLENTGLPPCGHHAIEQMYTGLARDCGLDMPGSAWFDQMLEQAATFTQRTAAFAIRRATAQRMKAAIEDCRKCLAST